VRTIVHLSDLHFNKIDAALVPKLVERVTELEPHIVAVSGDLTQHAWPSEFERAGEFLRALPGRLILVPGNHDMSFYNPWRRAVQRLQLYKRLITHDMQPYYADREVSVLGLNTARVSHLRNGRIREWQVDKVEELLGVGEPGAIRVLVTHHPFDLPESFAAAELIGTRVMRRVIASVDVMLAGHMHISHAAPTALRYKFAGHSAVFVQAGTALSIRGRGEPNSFQVIRTSPGMLNVEQYSADGNGFHAVKNTKFVRSASGWRAEVLEVHSSATRADLRSVEKELEIASHIPGNDVQTRHVP
jgi:3',5'-cyclic AMP phosphodiesterase CpdA